MWYKEKRKASILLYADPELTNDLKCKGGRNLGTNVNPFVCYGNYEYIIKEIHINTNKWSWIKDCQAQCNCILIVINSTASQVKRPRIVGHNLQGGRAVVML